MQRCVRRASEPCHHQIAHRPPRCRAGLGEPANFLRNIHERADGLRADLHLANKSSDDAADRAFAAAPQHLKMLRHALHDALELLLLHYPQEVRPIPHPPVDGPHGHLRAIAHLRDRDARRSLFGQESQRRRTHPRERLPAALLLGLSYPFHKPHSFLAGTGQAGQLRAILPQAGGHNAKPRRPPRPDLPGCQVDPSAGRRLTHDI